MTAFDTARNIHFAIQNGGFDGAFYNGHFDSDIVIDSALDELESLPNIELAQQVKTFWNGATNVLLPLYEAAANSNDDWDTDRFEDACHDLSTKYWEGPAQALTNAFAAADAEAHQLRPNVWEQNADLLGTPEELEAIAQAMA